MLKRSVDKSSLLSAKELELLQNSEILYLKSSALQKIRTQLEQFAAQLEPIVTIENQSVFNEMSFASPKISKGENYLALPYLVLDYPAVFRKESIFSFRTFFWWGNYFSFTLHLQGEFLKKFRSELLANAGLINEPNCYLCISEAPWNYTFEESNYKRASEFSEAELRQYFETRTFIKISSRLSIAEYEKLATCGEIYFRKMLSLLRKN